MAKDLTGPTELESMAAAATGLVINEVLASHAGTDTTEYVEFSGPAGASLDGLSLIVVEGDAGSAGAIDQRIDFGPEHRIGDNGFFLVGNPEGLDAAYAVTPDVEIAANFIENSSLTVMLVETASLSGTSVTGAETVVDSVGLNDGGAGDAFYGEGPVIGPDGSFFPAGVRRVADGVDTDSADDWALADFDLGADNTPTAAASAPVINEFVANHTGTDTSEYVEVRAAPGADLSNLTLIEIEGDGGGAGAGTIDGVWTLDAADAAGFWTTGFLGNEIENGTMTLLLVEGFTGSAGDDIDTDDDGIVDVAAWGSVVDGVAVSDGGADDLSYAETVLTPDFDGGAFTAGGASRIPDGADTDSPADWVRNDFDLGGIEAGTPEPGEALNTPGAENEEVGGGGGAPLSLVINELLADPAGDLSGDANGDGTRDASADEFVEIVNTGIEAADLTGVTISDAVGVRHVFAAGTMLAPGAAIVVFGGGTPAGDFGGAQVVTASGGLLGLNNGGDTVTLLAADGATVLDEVAYGGEGGNDQSLTRDPDVTGGFVQHGTVSLAPFSPGTASDGSPFTGGAAVFVESFEAEPGAGYTLTGAFDDGGFDFFGRFAAPDTENGARDDFTGGFDGGFAIYAQDNDGDGGPATGVVTIADIDISGQADPTLVASFGGLASAPDFLNYEGDDGIEIWASVDGAPRVLVGAFAPPAGGGDLLRDTDLDGVGDGDVLGTVLADFAFDLPEGDSLTLEVEMTSTDSFEPLVLDHVRVGDGLEVDDGGNGGDATSAEIYAIQGAGDVSSFEGQRVLVDAIVTAVTPGLDGFFIQEAVGDGDAQTSDGIFVFSDAAVSVGDAVTLTGTVEEFFGETQLGSVADVTVTSSGNALPQAAEITFPVATTRVNSDGEFIADLEMYEGMRVTVPQELTVADLFTLGRFGDIGLSAQGRLPSYTQTNAPDVEGFQEYQQEAVRNTLVLDDGSTLQNPATIPFETPDQPGDIPGQFDATDGLSTGDTVSGLTGVIRFSRASGGSGDEIYRLIASEDVSFEDTNPRPEEAPEVGGSLKVATFNVLNYFTSLGDEGLTSGPDGAEVRGADNTEEFARQEDKLLATLAELQADVFGLVEIENEFGDQNGDGEFAIGRIVAELNDIVPNANYMFAPPGTPYVGGDAISVGIIYNAATVQLAPGTTVETLDDSDLAGLGLDFGNPVFEGPGTSRVPMAATFEQLSTGETFTVAVNHFKSKGSVSPFGDNAGIGDGTGNNNEARLQAAMALDAWLDSDPTGSGDPDVMITGDLNAYAMEDPVQYLLSEGYLNLTAELGEGLDYSYGFPTDLDTSPASQAFGTLDYALASSSLFAQATGAAHWHVNADSASILDYNTNFKPPEQVEDLYAPDPFASSDHDPVLVGFDLQSAPELVVIEGTSGSEVLRGTEADERLIANGGPADQAIGGGGDDVFEFVDTEGRPDFLRVLDYTNTAEEQDSVDLGGIAIASSRSIATNLLVTLETGDRLLFSGVDSVDDIVFVDDLAVA